MTLGGKGPAYSQHPYWHRLPETIPQQILIWGFFSDSDSFYSLEHSFVFTVSPKSCGRVYIQLVGHIIEQNGISAVEAGLSSIAVPKK